MATVSHLTGAVTEIMEKGASHTIVLTEKTSEHLLTIELPKFLYRRYKLKAGAFLRVRIRPDKFCIIPTD